MGKSTNGPDWNDVAMMVSALHSLHGCSTSVELMPDLLTGYEQLQIVVISTWPSSVPLKRNPTLVTKHGVLRGEWAAAAADVFRAMHEHDAQISQRVYKQGTLIPEG